MSIEKMLTLSTAHITPADDEWLREEGTVGQDMCDGWLIPVCPVDYHKDRIDLPKNLDRLVYYAHGLGCEWIMLGNWEDPTDELPQFEW